MNVEIVSSRTREHSHPLDEAEMTASKGVEAMKQKIKKSIYSVPTIYQQQLQKVSVSLLKKFFLVE